MILNDPANQPAVMDGQTLVHQFRENPVFLHCNCNVNFTGLLFIECHEKRIQWEEVRHLQINAIDQFFGIQQSADGNGCFIQGCDFAGLALLCFQQAHSFNGKYQLIGKGYQEIFIRFRIGIFKGAFRINHTNDFSVDFDGHNQFRKSVGFNLEVILILFYLGNSLR